MIELNSKLSDIPLLNVGIKVKLLILGLKAAVSLKFYAKPKDLP
jgi:hypothetical protein